MSNLFQGNSNHVAIASASSLVSIHSQIVQNLLPVEPFSFFRHERQKNYYSNTKSIGISKNEIGDIQPTAKLNTELNIENSNKRIRYEELNRQIQYLKRQKVFLSAEIEREKLRYHMESSTIAENLAHTSSLSIMKDLQRQYLHEFDDGPLDLSLQTKSSSDILVKHLKSSDLPHSNLQSPIITIPMEQIINYQDNQPHLNNMEMVDNSKKSKSFVSKNETIDLATELSKVRTNRKYVAAHRLSGISCFHLEKENCIGAKIEVCIQGGIFVATHYVFFDFVPIQDSTNSDQGGEGGGKLLFYKRYQVRLIQHTLPHSISVDEIVKRNTSQETIFTRNQRKTSNNMSHSSIMQSLRNCLGEIYDTSYSYAMRVTACRQLESMADEMMMAPSLLHGILSGMSSKTSKSKREFQNSYFKVRSITHSDSYDYISFIISRTTSLENKKRKKDQNECLNIQLTYKNQLLCIPTCVHLILSNGSTREKSLTNIVGTLKEENNFHSTSNHKHETLRVFAAFFRVLHLVDAAKKSLKILQRDGFPTDGKIIEYIS